MLYLVGIRFLGFEKVSVGLLVAFGSYINMFWNPIMNLSNFYNNLVTNLTAAERIFDILDTEPDITDADDVEELPEVKGEVTFSHVGFTYDRGTPAETKVLEDVNFVVKPGETIALVGPTGAGYRRHVPHGDEHRGLGFRHAGGGLLPPQARRAGRGVRA